jgi:hypothetical protein
MTHCFFVPYVETHDCLSLRRDTTSLDATPSLNAITTVSVSIDCSSLFLSTDTGCSLAGLLSFGFITPPR